MKSLALVGLLALSATAVAAERSIVDLQYLPNAGTTYGFTDFSVLDGTIETETDKLERSGWELKQTVGHAFTDRLSLQASLGYLSATNDATPGDKTDEKGISDPTVQAKFRLMDEDFRWDIIGGALISLGDKEIKSDGDENNYQGGHNLFVGTQFGAKKENFQWSVTGLITHHMEATTKDKVSDEKIKDDARNDLTLGGDLLTKLTDISYIRTAFSATFEGEYDSDDDSTTIAQTKYLTTVEYRHLFSKDLMLKLGFNKTDWQHTAGAKVSDWSYNAGVNYQF